jgi:hypothetical protein
MRTKRALTMGLTVGAALTSAAVLAGPASAASGGGCDAKIAGQAASFMACVSVKSGTFKPDMYVWMRKKNSGCKVHIVVEYRPKSGNGKWKQKSDKTYACPPVGTKKKRYLGTNIAHAPKGQYIVYGWAGPTFEYSVAPVQTI